MDVTYVWRVSLQAILELKVEVAGLDHTRLEYVLGGMNSLDMVIVIIHISVAPQMK